jgi:hypothetical protein
MITPRIELPVFSRLAVARMQWQSALVEARRVRTAEAILALKHAEARFIDAHRAAVAWHPVPTPTPPRFRRMPKIDPYHVPQRCAA